MEASLVYLTSFRLGRTAEGDTAKQQPKKSKEKNEELRLEQFG